MLSYLLVSGSSVVLVTCFVTRTPPRQKGGTSLVRDVVGGLVAMPMVLGAMVTVGLFSKEGVDVAGAVAKRLPDPVAFLIRDSRLSWRVFTAFEAVGAFAALVEANARLRRLSFSTSFRQLAAAYREMQPLREQISETCVIDVYDNDDDRVLVLFVPGGAYSHADNASLYRLLARNAVKELKTSFAVVEYKPYPLTSGADMIRDVAEAVQWATESYDKVILVGHSAGAHMLATAFSTRSCRRRPYAALLCSGPYDLNKHVEHEARRGVEHVSALSAAFPSRHLRQQFSPVAMKTFEQLPERLILMHGARDTTVPPRSTQELADVVANAAAASSTSVETHILPDADHFDFLFQSFIDNDTPLLDSLRQLCASDG